MRVFLIGGTPRQSQRNVPIERNTRIDTTTLDRTSEQHVTNPQDPAAMFAAAQQAAMATQGFAPAPQGYQPQGYQPMPQQFIPQNVPPAQPAARGSLEAMFGQPNTGEGPAVKLNSQTPIGTTVMLIVKRDVVDGDVAQQTAPGTGVPVFRKDGTPVFRMVIPVTNVSNGNADEGLYVSGGLWTNLNNAMHGAGYPVGTAPKGGDGIKITVSSKYTNGFGTTSNRYEVEYFISQGNQAALTVENIAAQPNPEPPFTPDTSAVAEAYHQAAVQSATSEFTGETSAQSEQQTVAQVAAQGATAAPAPAPALDPAAAELLRQMGVPTQG